MDVPAAAGRGESLRRRILSCPAARLPLLIAIAAALWAVGIGQRWLWLDELLSVNFAANGPWVTLVTVLRYDVHPPLYYLQLSLWMLVGQGDLWLMANSLFWHTAAIALLVHGVGALHGARAGWAAGLLLAVSPAALLYDDQVRMYAFLMFLIVWAWYAQARWLEGKAGRHGGLWLVLSQAAVTASHAAGLLMLSGIVVLGAVTVLRPRCRHRLARWLLLEGAVLLLALPGIAIGLMRGVGHLRTPGLQDLLAIATFLAGGSQLPAVASLAMAAAVAAALALAAWRARGAALSIATLLAVPLLLAALASHLARPVWIERLFVPLIPCLCLCLAVGLCGRPVRRRADVALLLLAAAWAGAGLAAQATRVKVDGFHRVAEALRGQARPGDLVLVDGDFAYWSFMWSFAGPGWGEARHASVANADWDRLLRRLPRQLVAALDLSEADTLEERGGIALAMWDRRAALPPARGRIWLIRNAASPGVQLPGRLLAEQRVLSQIRVEDWVPVPSAAAGDPALPARY
ncbi:MAG: hypothetical protein U1E53_06875 [Dongiaceae bacterium]